MCAYTSREIFAVLMPGPNESGLLACWPPRTNFAGKQANPAALTPCLTNQGRRETMRLVNWHFYDRFARW
jgi:hypothetical protein